MANPQIEDGFTRVANEIFEQICQYTFNGSQFRILIIIWRMTYGYGRKDHDFAQAFLQAATKLSDSTVKRELAYLIKNKVLTVTKEPTNTEPRRLAFNKNYDEWLVVKSGDPMVKQLDLFSIDGGSDLTPQEEQIDEVGGFRFDPPEGSGSPPQEYVLRGQDRPPYKEIKILKKSIKEKENMFDSFWSIYPRKANKEYAIKTWKKHCKDESFDPDLVITNTKHYADTCQLLKTGMKYIAHASTFLNQKRYEDYTNVDPEGLAHGENSEFERDKLELQRMMQEAEERERNGDSQALLNHSD